MPDDQPPSVTDITEAPRRRRLGIIPPAPDIKGANREAVVSWMRGYMEEISRAYEERDAMMKAGELHPMPLYAKLVHNHAAMGLPKAQIARLLGISATILERYYADDMELGIAQINLRIASNVARVALSDDPNAAKIGLDWLDRRGGENWRKSAQRPELPEDRAPLIDASRLTPDEREQLRAMLTRIADAGDEPPSEAGENNS